MMASNMMASIKKVRVKMENDSYSISVTSSSQPLLSRKKSSSKKATKVPEGGLSSPAPYPVLSKSSESMTDPIPKKRKKKKMMRTKVVGFDSEGQPIIKVVKEEDEEETSTPFHHHLQPGEGNARKKKRGTEQQQEDGPVQKRERQHVSETADETMKDSSMFQLVFGGQVFHEDIRLLSCSKVLDSQIKEGYRRFCRKNWDPKEWVVVRELLNPFSSTRITNDNLSLALRWFHNLQIADGMIQCDEILAGGSKSVIQQHSLPLKRSKYTKDIQMTSTDMSEMLEVLDLAIQYDLAKSKEKCFETIREVLAEGPHWFDVNLITKVVDLVRSNPACQEEFMSTLESYIPMGNTIPTRELLSNPMFPLLIRSGIEGRGKGKDKVNQMKRNLDKMIETIDKMGQQSRVCSLKKEIKKDRGCRKMLPKGW